MAVYISRNLRFGAVPPPAASTRRRCAPVRRGKATNAPENQGRQRYRRSGGHGCVASTSGADMTSDQKRGRYRTRALKAKCTDTSSICRHHVAAPSLVNFTLPITSEQMVRFSICKRHLTPVYNRIYATKPFFKKN